MHYHVSEHEAAEIIAQWLRQHGHHEGYDVLESEASWSVVMSCPGCGIGAFRTISKKNGAYEAAMAGSVARKSEVWTY